MAVLEDGMTMAAPATFFIHSFYLALFFWMLASALLLLYRTFNVFDVGLSKKAMLIIGFSLGYGAPLIIATITIAVTAPSNHYIGEKNVFWLSWDTHKTSLAFVIPALTIVAINIIILTLVISKILRRRVGMIGTQAKERHALLAIVRCTAVLTPIFGVIWVLGIGTMVSENVGLDVAFALLNSLQVIIITTFLNCDLSARAVAVSLVSSVVLCKKKLPEAFNTLCFDLDKQETERKTLPCLCGQKKNNVSNTLDLFS
uniref:G-protein coupled receptors family 2 profile 2 domain-containing protein n=1 Tax=Xiphophorus couchianus TaxID=32473 RepID=A0A3B5LQH4_9TELE